MTLKIGNLYKVLDDRDFFYKTPYFTEYLNKQPGPHSTFLFWPAKQFKSEILTLLGTEIDKDQTLYKWLYKDKVYYTAYEHCNESFEEVETG